MYEALKPYWYPLALSTDVVDKPVAAELLGERVAIYRADGKVRAVRDLCIHRGTPLSLGWIDGDTLVCAYHGWGYAPDGACVRIPSLPPGRAVPPKARVDAFLRERHVWVLRHLDRLAREREAARARGAVSPRQPAGRAG